MKKEIFVTRAFLPPKEEYIEKLDQIWESHILTNMGPLHKEFEEKLTQFLQVPHCLAFANGHLSLEMALQAINITGEVITTPFTFASTTHAIVRSNLTPVFCDINETNYTIDAGKIEELITERTTAIVPVHVYGQICDVDRIQKIADKHHLKVIYDAAHAFGEAINGVGVGNFGDASAFSFHATKPFNAIEGGAVTLKDYEYGVKMYQLKNFGFMGEDMVCGVGANAKLSEFHAAMGLCNLNHFHDITQERKRVVEQYRNRLTEVKGIRILDKQDGVTENYSYFPIVIDRKIFGDCREGVYKRLLKKGIHARRYFYPLTKDFPCYQSQYGEEETPIAEYVSKNIVTLPLYDELSNEEVNYICDVMLDKD